MIKKEYVLPDKIRNPRQMILDPKQAEATTPEEKGNKKKSKTIPLNHEIRADKTVLEAFKC